MVRFDEFTSRILSLCDGLNMEHIDPVRSIDRIYFFLYIIKVVTWLTKKNSDLNRFRFIIKASVTLQVINGIHAGVTTQELDTIAADMAAMMATDHADYAVLTARIAVSNLHKETRELY